jgi:hypothetical protein
MARHCEGRFHHRGRGEHRAEKDGEGKKITGDAGWRSLRLGASYVEILHLSWSDRFRMTAFRRRRGLLDIARKTSPQRARSSQRRKARWR